MYSQNKCLLMILIIERLNLLIRNIKKNEKQLRKWKDVQPINKCLNL